MQQQPISLGNVDPSALSRLWWGEPLISTKDDMASIVTRKERRYSGDRAFLPMLFSPGLGCHRRMI